MLGDPLSGSALQKNGLAFLQDLDEVGKTLVDCNGIVHCELIQHPENPFTIYFILQFLYSARNFQYSVLILD